MEKAEPRPRWSDPWLWTAVVLGLLLRWAPHWIWGFGAPIRDEAIYLQLARRIANGGGMGAPKSWLWAPGYPYFLALFKGWTPIPPVWIVPWLQGLLGAASVVLMYWLCVRVLGDRRSARVGAWLYALHPTLIFFAGRLWSEAVYGPVLLAAVLGLLWCRDGSWRRAAVPGLLLGLCVLLRGVATYLPPIFVLALLWPVAQESWREGARARWRHGLALVLVCATVVAPYSVHATRRYGSFVVNDATLGNLMYLGNNDFSPITFDYGNGVLRDVARHKSTRLGRKHCRDDDPIEWNACETERGLAWIRTHPGEFFRRVPMRVGQLLNPHSFLTRSLRWARWRGIPWWLKEGLVIWVAGWSFAVMLGGTAGAAARSRGPYAPLAWGIVMYTVAASAATYGLTRFRLPLEPLWMVFLAAAIAHPRATWALIRSEPKRLGTALIFMPLVLIHLLWFLPSGWPGFNW